MSEEQQTTLPKITDGEIKRPTFRTVDIDELKPYPNNPRDHSEEDIRFLMHSLAYYGWRNPVQVAKGTNLIVAGHGRVEAARRLGLRQIPVVESEDTDENHRGYRIADNKSQELSSWSDKRLNLELVELDAAGFNVGFTGFSDLELQDRIEGYGGENGSASPYTDQIEIPIYTPKGAQPAVSELYDLTKTNQLLEEIEVSAAPDEVKEFLRYAAQRHCVFDYENIAEYYAHAPKDVQELMEKSALVIIDFKKAIENGFVAVTKEIAGYYPPDDAE